MELRSLNTFIQVAECGSFTRAAEILGYSQPTISIQIKQLEKELGIKLFDRIGHTVRLTEGGHTALYHAQRICRMCQEMALGGEEGDFRGTVRLAMADSLCAALLRKGFAAFREHHENISINITAAGTTELFRMLDHNEVDLVCTLDSHIYSTNYIVAHEEKIGVHFVVASSHPLAKNKVVSVSDLMNQPFILTEKGMSYRRLLDEWLASSSMEIQPVLETGSADLICTLVEQGIGMSFLPDYVTQDAVNRGSIVRLSADGFSPDLWKQLLHHRDKWISPPLQAVIHYLGDIMLAER